jgi:ribosomal protein S18 acetylase RimI-like enzyme
MRLAAAERLLGRRHADAVWFLKRLEDDGWRADDLWCRSAPAGAVLAAGLISEHPGRTASISLGPCHGADALRHATDLLRDMVAELGRRGSIRLAQGMTAAEDADAGEPFVRAGFIELAVLACMERPNGRHQRAPGLPSGVTLHPVEHDAALRALLRATYEETLDCPGLADLRTDEDILDGHRRGGKADPSLWTVLRVDDRDAGAALLNRGSSGDTVELCYLGLAKWARGKGLGALLLDEALAKASRLRERTVTLAVDERNTPAERLYRSRGFRTIARRRAFARRVDSST